MIFAAASSCIARVTWLYRSSVSDTVECPQPFLRDARMHAGEQQLRCMGMAEVMKPRQRYPLKLCGKPRKPVCQLHRGYRLAIRPSAQERVLRLPNSTTQKRLGLLSLAAAKLLD